MALPNQKSREFRRGGRLRQLARIKVAANLHSLKRKDEALAAWRPIAEGTNRTAKNLQRLGEVLAGFGYRPEALAALEQQQEQMTIELSFWRSVKSRSQLLKCQFFSRKRVWKEE